MTCTFWLPLSFGALLICTFALGWNLVVFYRVRRVQRQIEARQNMIEAVTKSEPMLHAVTGATQWRDLDPEGQRLFRDALAMVVADMDANMTTLH